MEALWAESSFHNYANDGVRGPEDDSGTPGTDDRLRTAPETMALPHDLVGTDHASGGVLQQQVGPGFGWGSVAEAMDPGQPRHSFVDRAKTSKKRGQGADFVAQSVQRSKYSGGRNYSAHRDQAQALIDCTRVLPR